MFTHSPAHPPFVRPSLTLSVLALLALGTTAHAQTTYIAANTTLNATNPVPGDANVGYANYNDYVSHTNGTSPTVAVVSGGSVRGTLTAYNSSTINFRGGSADTVDALNNSTINFSGGSVAVVEALDNSTVNITGGSVSVDLEADNNSTINLSGGSVGSYLVVYDSSTLNIFGTGLTATFNYVDSTNFIVYSLSGTLSDGTALVNKELEVQQGSSTRVSLNNTPVPEPGSVALFVGLGISGASVFARRIRRK